jgi:hypothetical protein
VKAIRMPRRNSGRVVCTIAVLVAFVAITTFGGLLHYHKNPLRAETCPICQAMHLPITPAPPALQLPALARVGRVVSLAAPLVGLAPASSSKFSRAPPA